MVKAVRGGGGEVEEREIIVKGARVPERRMRLCGWRGKLKKQWRCEIGLKIRRREV